LYSLMAAGTNDLLNLSVLQLMERSWSLWLLCWATTVSCSGWLLLLRMDFIILLILFSTNSESTLLPSTDTHFLTSLSSQFPSLAFIQLPQQTTAKNTALATIDQSTNQKVGGSIPGST